MVSFFQNHYSKIGRRRRKLCFLDFLAIYSQQASLTKTAVISLPGQNYGLKSSFFIIQERIVFNLFSML